MKKLVKIILIMLTVLSTIFIFFAQIPKSNAQAQVNYASYNYTKVEGTDINASIVANVGILTDGGISLWSIVPTITTNMSITSVIVRGKTNGSTFNRGLTFPSTAELDDDRQLLNITTPYNKIFSEWVPSMKENLLLFPDLYGIPNLFSFNLTVYIGNLTKNQTIHLSSGDSPLITIILRNPEAVPALSGLFFTLMYSLPFLLPITVIIIYLVFKKIQKKQKVGKGGQKNET